MGLPHGVAVAVEHYPVVIGDLGGHVVKLATRVSYSDGVVVHFDRVILDRREALSLAAHAVAQNPGRFAPRDDRDDV